jgi:hypothetical protein
MRLRKFFISSLLALTTITISVSQEEKQKIVNEKGQLEITPEMAERARRQREKLREPSFIKLEIVGESKRRGEEAKKVSGYYRTHAEIELKLLMTNTSSEAINITVSDSYYPYNLQLYRNGELVPYREDVAGIVDKPPVRVSSMIVTLEPGKIETAEVIYLSKWYKPLEPGHYQLVVKRRFVLDGGWTESASTTFEVGPK